MTDAYITELLLNLFLKLSVKKSWRDTVGSDKLDITELYLIVKKYIYFRQHG